MAAPQDVEPQAPTLKQRVDRMRSSELFRQNLVLFIGGMVAGGGGFIYHAIATRFLGRSTYDEVAALIAIFAVAGNVPTLILVTVLARYSATLLAEDRGDAIRHVLVKTTRLTVGACVIVVALCFILARPIASFEQLNSPSSVMWLGGGIAAIWLVAIPRGVLQGTQHFKALSLNLSLEMVIRMSTLLILLGIGLRGTAGVNAGMFALLTGAGTTFVIGMGSLRHWLSRPGIDRAPLRAMAGFSATAAAGIFGVQMLFNVDVVLAAHYLSKDAGGIYGSLNKIETIIIFGTISLSQVMFPRVVEALARNTHPGRLLLLSGASICVLGGCALIVFGLFPDFIVRKLYGASFTGGAPYIFEMGLIGLGVSLVNLLVQFFLAAHDRAFVPVLALGLSLEMGLIYLRHGSVGDVVVDVLLSMVVLLAALSVRCVILLAQLHGHLQQPPEEPVVEAPITS